MNELKHWWSLAELCESELLLQGCCCPAAWTDSSGPEQCVLSVHVNAPLRKKSSSPLPKCAPTQPEPLQPLQLCAILLCRPMHTLMYMMVVVVTMHDLAWF